jgi:uncharacterized membrane protein YcfT
VAPESEAHTIDWLDGVKGACMVLVVLLHVSAWYLQSDVGTTRWDALSVALTPLRMPTFFLVSGILAKTAVDKSWPKVRRRSLNLYFVYLLWTTLISLRLFIPIARGDKPVPNFELLGANAIVPAVYWYLWALPLYYLLATAGRRLLGRHSPWLLLPAVLVSFFASELDTLFRPHYPQVLDGICAAETMQNFVWFYLGIVAKDWIIDTFDHATRRALLVALAVAVSYIAVVNIGGETPTSVIAVGGTARLVQIVETPGYMVVMLAAFIVLRRSMIARLFDWIGRGTLSVYIFHWFGLMATTVVLIGMPHPRLAAWLGWVVPVALSFAIVIACRAVGIVVCRSRIGWVLNGPFPLTWWQRVSSRRGYIGVHRATLNLNSPV